MPTLDKELKKIARKNSSNLDQFVAVTQTQKLIADKGAEDMEWLTQMGMHHSVVRAKKVHGDAMELAALEEKYGKIFTSKDIKDVACKYALKFLRSDNYRGDIDPMMLQKMREFFKDAGIEMNHAKLGYSFYVLAPPKAFQLLETPKPIPRDPILFYKIDEGHYRLIHKWGKDMSFVRRIIGFKYTSEWNYFLIWVLSLFVPSFLLLAGILRITHQPISFALLTLIPSVVISIIRIANGDWGGIFRIWKHSFLENIKQKY